MALFQFLRKLSSPPSGWGKNKEPTSRREMDDALKRLVLPELRAMGFKGSMPHLRRPRRDHWDLLTFQFSKHGGAFTVETARCGPGGITDFRGHVPAEKVTAWDVVDRYRVGAERPRTDHWFKFEKAPADQVAERLLGHLRGAELWRIVDTLPAGRTES